MYLFQKEKGGDRQSTNRGEPTRQHLFFLSSSQSLPIGFVQLFLANTVNDSTDHILLIRNPPGSLGFFLISERKQLSGVLDYFTLHPWETQRANKNTLRSRGRACDGGQGKNTEPTYRGFLLGSIAISSTKNILWPAMSALTGAGVSQENETVPASGVRKISRDE